MRSASRTGSGEPLHAPTGHTCGIGGRYGTSYKEYFLQTSGGTRLCKDQIHCITLAIE